MMVKELRTVLRSDGTPELELVRGDGMLTIYEADNMDHQVELSESVIPELILQLQSLK
jgi:hypothetical protein